MPELPEVETVARSLAPHVKGRVICGTQLLLDSTLHPLSLPLSSLLGRTIAGVSRRGKLLIINLDPVSSPELPTCVVVHLRMTGRLLTREANAKKGSHTRCILELQDACGQTELLFFDDTRTFGKILVAAPAILEQWKFWRDLGPEPFDLSGGEFLLRLGRKMAIKSCLLDQGVLAGVGNIYADESLFQAGIRPDRPAASLTKEEAAKLLKALCKVLRLSIKHCGSSIRDYMDAEGNVGSFQNKFMVYGRGGEACRKCGATLERMRLGGRATVFCPHCQH